MICLNSYICLLGFPKMFDESQLQKMPPLPTELLCLVMKERLNKGVWIVHRNFVYSALRPRQYIEMLYKSNRLRIGKP